MKNIYKIIAVLLLAISVTLFFFITDTKDDSQTSNDTDNIDFIVQNEKEYVVDPSDIYTVDQDQTDAINAITEAEALWLKHMREEEKLARDVYLTLADTWNLQIFSNIAKSEQSHTDAVKKLLDRYEIVDPVTDDSIGIFTNQVIQNLYNELTRQGTQSRLDALLVGATIEDLDIHDLDLAMAEKLCTKIYKKVLETTCVLL